MYGLQRLMLICEDRLCNHINTDSVAIMLVLAEKHHCIRLKEVCFQFLSSSTALVEFMESSDFLYFMRSCPTVLKDLIYNLPQVRVAKFGHGFLIAGGTYTRARGERGEGRGRRRGERSRGVAGQVTVASRGCPRRPSLPH
uniref:BPM/SPOP BACK domain-containing protein n=1 Tax=Oryza glumipatula TaxID=40148 RepID=A0A0E0BAU5_9ORYZ